MRKKILILSCRFQTYSVLNLAPFSSISDLIVRPIVNLHFLDNYNISCCTPNYNLYGFLVMAVNQENPPNTRRFALMWRGRRRNNTLVKIWGLSPDSMAANPLAMVTGNMSETLKIFVQNPFIVEKYGQKFQKLRKYLLEIYLKFTFIASMLIHFQKFGRNFNFKFHIIMDYSMRFIRYPSN